MNNLFKKIPILAGFAVLFIARGLAQTQGEKLDIPQPPFIASLPKFAHYSIRVEGNVRGAKEAALARVDVTKLNDIKAIMETFSDGKTKTFWLRGGLVMISGTLRVDAFHPDAIASDVPLSGDDFTGFDWLTLASYVGVANIQARKCYSFESGGKQALIDIESKLPTILKEGQVVYQFEYGAAPPETATWPPEYEQCWQRYLAVLRAMTGKSGPR